MASVDLPDPLVPTSATRSPGVRAKSTSWTTVGPSYANDTRFAVTTTGPVAGPTCGRAGRGAPSSSGSHAPAATRRERDRARTSAGRPTSIWWPSGPRASTRSAIGHATSTRCSTMTMVTARDRRSDARRAANARAAGGSRLAVGSSSTRIPGRGASAPASASRCCWPPDSFVVRDRSSPAEADLVERLGNAEQHRVPGPAATLEPERDVVLDALHDQLALGVLEHEPDARRHLRTRRRRRVEPIDRQPPLEVTRELARHQSRDSQRERALARPRRPDDQQALAGLDLERDVGERLDRAAGEPEAEPVGADRARPAGARLRRQLGTPPGRRPAAAPGPARPTRRPRSRRPRSPSSGPRTSCTSSETSE